MIKRAYLYRFYPTPEQAHNFACTFGCTRFVYNWALKRRKDAYFQQGQKLTHNKLSQALTALKKAEGTAWLCEVSSVPLQQALRHLDTAYTNFFEGRAKYPTCKKKHGVQAATYTDNAFKWDGTHLMLKNHCLAKAISDVGWSEFVRQLEYKAKWYGRAIIRIDRFYPSSKTCSACGVVLEELALDFREWSCEACGTWHDRDINAAKNIAAAGLAVLACGGDVRPVRAKVQQAVAGESGKPCREARNPRA